MDEREFFDKIAPSWDDNEVLSTPENVNRILDYMDLKPGDEVLDLGTGTGVLLPFIVERIGENGKITAVDYSSEMLKRAKSKFSSLNPLPEFLNIDFETENIEGEYDCIILYCVYPHLHNPYDTLKWLRSVNLKKGGKMFIAFPSKEDFINNIHKEKHSESDILPSADILASLLNQNGLKAESVCDNYVVRVSA